mmetsp:Transcript_19226/g.18360  ORF Transcript_19226/g.18360 Transcript_19226/m.18360 type:complete len:213 (-) Transcript_19226:96-734(-)
MELLQHNPDLTFHLGLLFGGVGVEQWHHDVPFLLTACDLHFHILILFNSEIGVDEVVHLLGEGEVHVLGLLVLFLLQHEAHRRQAHLPGHKVHAIELGDHVLLDLPGPLQHFLGKLHYLSFGDLQHLQHEGLVLELVRNPHVRGILQLVQLLWDRKGRNPQQVCQVRQRAVVHPTGHFRYGKECGYKFVLLSKVVGSSLVEPHGDRVGKDAL